MIDRIGEHYVARRPASAVKQYIILFSPHVTILEDLRLLAFNELGFYTFDS